jgi:Zn-dependent protease
MLKPSVVSEGEQVTTVGKMFDTPLVVKGYTWLPLTQFVFWGIMAWYAGKRGQERSWEERIKIGVLTMLVMLGSEWGHNLAHAAAARTVGKPMDCIRITWGMPLLVYYDINDPDVTPRQHILRALGGPVFNFTALTLSLVLREFTRPNSHARDVADVAVSTNAFLPSAGLLPIPGLDGGPILKWSLVERGRTPEEADEIVQKVDKIAGVGLGIASAAAFKKRRRLLGGLLALLSTAALAVGFGLLKEQE